ncbi:DUF2254 family protein [Facklamia lactis]|uniref:DUF2254 family protein n=1 Tax=Facklamia lactis TaxID=2749967 RepID=UPI0018CE182F|nr:DUF2254 family protein [Facklamia lactis]MBG9979570.1 DUF2254 domain-containing protein [Facklamia lactis]
MVVLTNFSSQYSESLVENFLDNTVTLKVFGIFFGGFTYTITSLLLFDMNIDNEKVIVASVCIVYVLVDLIYFNGFIRAVINYIQPNGLVIRLQREAEEHLDIYERSIEGKEILDEPDLPSEHYAYQYSVLADKDGYIQEVDVKKVCQRVTEAEKSAIFHHVVGVFITLDTPMFTILSHEEIPSEELERWEQDLLACVSIGYIRTGHQDFFFSIQKIMDISMKSITSTIYAPNSTLSSMNVIKVLLRRIAQFKDGYLIEGEDMDRSFVAFKTLDFSEVIQDIYDPVLNYGFDNGIIIKYIFQSLETISQGASEENRAKVVKYVENIQKYLEKHKEDHVNYHYEKDYQHFVDKNC